MIAEPIQLHTDDKTELKRLRQAEKRFKERADTVVRQREVIAQLWEYINLTRKVYIRRSTWLTGAEKVACSIILDMIMLGTYDQRRGYTRIRADEVKEYSGEQTNTLEIIKRLLAMELFLWSDGDKAGEYWIAIPKDFEKRIDNPPAEHKRATHSAWKFCPTHQKQERVKHVFPSLHLEFFECGLLVASPIASLYTVMLGYKEKQPMTLQQFTAMIWPYIKDQVKGIDR